MVVSARQKFASVSYNSVEGQYMAATVVFRDPCSDLSTLAVSVYPWLSFPRIPHVPK